MKQNIVWFDIPALESATPNPSLHRTIPIVEPRRAHWLTGIFLLGLAIFSAQAEEVGSQRVRISFGHRASAKTILAPRCLASGPDVQIADVKGVGLEPGDVLGSQPRVEVGAGDVDAIEATVTWKKPSQPKRGVHEIWAYLLEHGTPDQIARIKDDPGLQPDAPVLTVQLADDGTRGFSVGLEQLLRHKAMWLPEQDAFITLADAPMDFAAHLASLKGERVLDRVAHEPEATLAEWTGKWADFGDPAKPHHGNETSWMGTKGHLTGFVARHGSLYKFGIDRWASVRPDLAPQHKFRFDPLWPDSKWTGQRIVDGLPILVTNFEREGLRCEVEQIVEPLRDTPPEKRGEISSVVLSRFRFTGTGPLSFGFRLATESTDRHPEMREVGGRWCVVDRETGNVWLMLEPGPGLTLKARAPIDDVKDPRIEIDCTGTLAAGETREILVKLPAPTVPTADVSTLAALAFAKARVATVNYWEGWLAQGARFDVPEKTVNDLFRANLWHALMLPRFRFRTGNVLEKQEEPYELGTVFRSNVAGSITHLRVYALAGESGPHTARLWRNSDNTILGTYLWTYGGTPGWTLLHIPDVAIAADTDYTVSVSNGADAAKSYPTIGNALTAAGGNNSHLSYPANAGVFTPTLGQRPTTIFNSTNYLRDVVFIPGTKPTPATGESLWPDSLTYHDPRDSAPLIDLPYSNFAYGQLNADWPINQGVYVDYMLYGLRGHYAVAGQEFAAMYHSQQKPDGRIGGEAEWGVYSPGMLYPIAQNFLLSADRTAFERLLPASLKTLDWCLGQVIKGQGNKEAPGTIVGPLNDLTHADRAWGFPNGYFVAGLDAFARALSAYGHPRAAEVAAIAKKMHADVTAAFARGSVKSPIVQLADGTWSNYVPCDATTPRRLLDEWYPTDVDCGPLHMARLAAIDPRGWLATAMLHDHEDNLFLNQWGAANEPVYNQQATAYLYRDEPEAVIRAFYSMLACAFSRGQLTPIEHRWKQPQYYMPPSTDGAWFELYRNMLLNELSGNGTLFIGQAVPRAWLADGKKISVEKAPTYFGPVNVKLVSAAASGTLDASVAFTTDRRPATLVVRLRHPEKKPPLSVTVNGAKWSDFDPAKETIRIPVSKDARYEIRAQY